MIDYQWNDDLFTYLSWSTAYKAGGFADFINDDTGSAAVRPIPVRLHPREAERQRSHRSRRRSGNRR